MSKDSIVQCDSKQFLIDSFDVDKTPVKVYVYNNKRSIKEYCKQTGLRFEDGFRNAGQCH